jgi:hypothetical protein
MGVQVDLPEIKEERQRWIKIHSGFWTEAVDWMIPEIERLRQQVQQLEWDCAEAMAIVLSHEAHIEKLTGKK